MLIFTSRRAVPVAGGTLRWYHFLGRQAKLFRFYRGYLDLGPPLIRRLWLGRAAVADRRATKHQWSSPLRLTEVDAPPRSPDRRAPPTAPRPGLTACRRCIRRAPAGGLPEPPAGPPLLNENRVEQVEISQMRRMQRLCDIQAAAFPDFSCKAILSTRCAGALTSYAKKLGVVRLPTRKRMICGTGFKSA